MPDEQQQDAARARRALASSASAETARERLRIDFGQLLGDHDDDVDINLDFGGAPAEPKPRTIRSRLRQPPRPRRSRKTDEAEPDEETDAGHDGARGVPCRAEGQAGDWYVVHTYSGMENRVLQNLENRVSSLNMEDYIYEIIVPTEEVTEIRNGQRKQVRRTVLPGYVLVRMDLTDESWSTVRHTPSVTGFVGHSNSPVPLSLDEVEKMLAPAVVAAATASSDSPHSS